MLYTKIHFETLIDILEDETIKLLEQHGIKFLPVDQSTVVANALRRGQIAVLTGNNFISYFAILKFFNVHVLMSHSR